MDIDVELVTDAIPPGLIDVIAIEGEEQIGQLPEWSISLRCRDRSITSSRLIGARAALVFSRRHEPPCRRISGLLWHVTDDFGTRTDRELNARHLTARFSPPAHLARLVRVQEVYQELSVPEIIEQKLSRSRIPHAFRLAHEYPVREFVMQYQETDLAFVSRLAEHLGIAFFFEHIDDQEVMVFTDNGQFHDLPPERGVLPFGGDGADALDQLVREEQLVEAFYAVSDFNYRMPALDLTAASRIERGFGGGIVEYGGHYKTLDEGQRLSQVRSEMIDCRRLTYVGAGSNPEIAAGAFIQLKDHPELGQQALLATRVRHSLTSDPDREGELGYRQRFWAIDKDTPFRPELRTPVPRIQGVVNGLVEALPESDGSKPWLDEFGRYRIRIILDGAAHVSNSASRAMRMVQNHAGTGYGTHFPLRPGTEVAIGFVGADVDRPVILGAMPNHATPSPVNDAEALHHRIQTFSGVYLEIEDGF
ncbi:MAG: type VI secretion system tip protein TssI/VgrG [Myxococcota bacterium]